MAGAPTRFEAWLVASDRAVRPWLPPLPSPAVLLTELAYFVCYPLVPLSFLIVWTRGTPADVSRFWLAVLLSGYACYASLPWLLSRPPRTFESAPPGPRTVRAMNALVLRLVSHEWNTFPSGHVAVALAAAYGVAQVSTIGGLVVGLVAVAVAAGAVWGRYHYVVDVAAGVLVAAAAMVITW